MAIERWKYIERPYEYSDVMLLRGSLKIKYTLAEIGAIKFWNRLQGDKPVAALGALTGNQAVQQVRAGLKSIYIANTLGLHKQTISFYLTGRRTPKKETLKEIAKRCRCKLGDFYDNKEEAEEREY